jgi:phosphotransferase system HPr (HPr) family protein
MQSIVVMVNHPVGLHARPAAQFVQTANQFEAQITVANKTKESDPVNAKSILSILTLGVHQGYEIEITADGSDEENALEVLEQLVADNFGE